MAITKRVVLFHENPLVICPDGMASCWVAWQKFREDAEYIPVRYQKPMPKFELGEHVAVYILDFSYPRDVLERLKECVGELVVLDHHTTAERDLEGLDYARFDKTKSGAVMSWEYFFPDEDMPDILKYIQDRDLWQFKYPETKPLTASIYNHTENSNMLFWRSLCYDENIRMEVRRGKILLDANEAEIKEFLEPRRNCFKVMKADTVTLAIYNTTTLISEKAHAILKTCPEIDYVMSYLIDSDGDVNLSFRSRPNGIDVGKVAKIYGGGGRETTAGAIMKGERGHQVLSQLLLAKEIPVLYKTA